VFCQHGTQHQSRTPTATFHFSAQLAYTRHNSRHHMWANPLSTCGHCACVVRTSKSRRPNKGDRTQSSLSLADCRGIREYSGRRPHDFNGRAGRPRDYPREEERLARISVSFSEFGADDAPKELMVVSQPLGVDQESHQGGGSAAGEIRPESLFSGRYWHYQNVTDRSLR